MKKDIHPKYQKVLFVDSSTGRKYLIGSTLHTDQKEVHEGVEYPVLHISISSSSHPFFVGGKQIMDTEGRIDKFNKRYLAAQKQAEVVKAAAEKPVEKVKAKAEKTKAEKSKSKKTEAN